MTGVFAHVEILVQSRQDDGSFYTIYYHPRYFFLQTTVVAPNADAGLSTLGN